MNDSRALAVGCRELMADTAGDVDDDLVLRLALSAQGQGAIGRSCRAVGLEYDVVEFAEACPVPAVAFRQLFVTQRRLIGIASRIAIAVVEDEQVTAPVGGAEAVVDSCAEYRRAVVEGRRAAGIAEHAEHLVEGLDLALVFQLLPQGRDGYADDDGQNRYNDQEFGQAISI